MGKSSHQQWLRCLLFWGVPALLTLLLLLSWAIPFATQAGNFASEVGLSSEAAASAAEKLRGIQQGSLARQSSPVRISEGEANSYLYYERAPRFPPGLSNVRLRFTPNRISGSAEVDFDKVRERLRRPSHPVMDYLFQGVRTLTVEGAFSGAGGLGQFDLETVALDGVVLPPPVVDFMIERYLKARFPTIALDRPFLLPFSIDSVQVETGSVALAGRPTTPL